MNLIKLEQVVATPWKNGGGITRELYCYPVAAKFDDFVWRVSVAELSQASVFSIFPGVDRVITVLEGEGLDMNTLTLRPFQPYRFCGEQIIHAQPQGGVCQDFNLMLRRGTVSGEVQVWHGDHEIGENCVVLFCAQGKWEISPRVGASVLFDAKQTWIRNTMRGKLSLCALQADSIVLSVMIHEANQHE